MSRRFYALWAAALALAIILPIAVPYALWPPREGLQADPAQEFRRRAELQVEAQDYVLPYTPLSSTVEGTSAPGGPAVYRAEVTARGPYGIPFASFVVTERDIDRTDAPANEAAAALALLAGVLLVSMPFASYWLRRALGARLAARPA